MTPGDIWYLVPTTWFQRWAVAKLFFEVPTPIVTDTLVSRDNKSAPFARKYFETLLETKDASFVAVPPSVWVILKKEYNSVFEVRLSLCV